ncbi:MAG: nucleotidyl transferase AbiEii/AbiGii toxin family protein [Candidatus Gracilibacteria bacterium]|nr:nucleotidyl transferase AbiEii/AbiGii toxin family protein [Candidatus Gracilibacteria bacterium]
MHLEILSPEQIDLFRLLAESRKRSFYMVGGTAIALHLGHRKSIDFDLFRRKNFKGNTAQTILDASKTRWQILHIHEEGQYTGVIHDVKVTFFYYPFDIDAVEDIEQVIKIPSLLTLAAMKAYAMGRRAKWKDYVDLYFIIRDHYTIREISAHAQAIFPTFQSAQFIEQLAYHEDISYTEGVEYLIPNPPTDAEIREFLRVESLKD